MQNTDTSNIRFQQAVAFVNQTNQHLFLTGKAGTGKTTFLKYIREHCYKKMAVVAPTGVAAINAGGVTIHSFFQLPFGTYLPTQKTVWGGEFQNVHNKNQLLAKLRFNSAKRDLIRELDLLIIDEISMVRADVMDAIDAVLRSVRRRLHEPFGGVQLLFIGDMFQLPPVVRDNEWELMSEYYNSPFFFDAHGVKEASPLYIELKKIYRQSDSAFISILNHVRNNSCTEEDLEYLQQHYHPHFIPDRHEGFITLTSHNNKADAINQQELERLPGKIHTLAAKVLNDFPEHAYPVEKELHLKEGAQIMFIKNDKGEQRKYYNGKIGTIERIDEYDKLIFVSFPGEKDLLQLEMETWRNIRYQYDNEQDEIKEEELGTFSQYPIRLAWAVTIHKSQGLTFEKAIVDAGQSFAPGQVYVALSRLTGLEGLVLKSRITAASIMTDERILTFAEQEESEDRLQRILEDSQEIFTEQSLLQAFSWDKLNDAWQLHLEEFNHRSLPDQHEAVQLSHQIFNGLLQQQKTAGKFAQLLQDLFKEGKAAYARMHERTAAASAWFVKDLEEKAISPLKTHIDAEKVKTRTKKYVKELRELLLIFERKKLQIQQAAAITEGLAQALDRQQLMDRVSRLHSPIEVKAEEKTGRPAAGESKKISLQLFKEGKSIEEIASLRGLVKGTIEGHLVEFIPTGEVEVTDLVQQAKLDAILRQLQADPGATSGTVREKLGDHYSFGEIKAGIAFWKKKQEQPGQADVGKAAGPIKLPDAIDPGRC
ncbi:helix-turn-helix domain-containing protein [Taibaiella helva]|uniref:helix-turn-helix domain-containing protein n=1 Tax=Taibaiella helva TaxID=2301235 RepID=UPI000E56F206|nr:helix-turn-helix domain-containing protein [Taibaiella helva]